MQLQLVDKTDKMIRIGLLDADTTIIMPIIEKLDNNKDVKIVRFIETHPELDTPALYVEMRKGDAKKAIVAAANELSEYFGSISE